MELSTLQGCILCGCVELVHGGAVWCVATSRQREDDLEDLLASAAQQRSGESLTIPGPSPRASSPGGLLCCLGRPALPCPALCAALPQPAPLPTPNFPACLAFSLPVLYSSCFLVADRLFGFRGRLLGCLDLIFSRVLEGAGSGLEVAAIAVRQSTRNGRDEPVAV